jgi:hypothetical protein
MGATAARDLRPHGLSVNLTESSHGRHVPSLSSISLRCRSAYETALTFTFDLARG